MISPVTLVGEVTEMDQLLYTRIAMSGWLFVAVVLGTLWRDNGDHWDKLVTEIRMLGSSGNGAIAAAAIGATIGVGAPPAIGFLFERSLSVVGVALASGRPVRRTARYRDSVAALLDEAHAELIRNMEGRAVFSLLFHSKDNELVVRNRDWKRAQAYASCTSAEAILAGLAVTHWIFEVDDRVVIWASGVAVSVLMIHGVSNAMRAHAIERTWAGTMGLLAAQDFATEFTQVPLRQAPRITLERPTKLEDRRRWVFGRMRRTKV